MAKRDNHYEAAFEAWLRWLRVPYVAVDESHRSAAPDQRPSERSRASTSSSRRRFGAGELARRCEGPPVSHGRAAVLAQLVHRRRARKPGPLGGAVRRLSRPACSSLPTTSSATRRRCRPRNCSSSRQPLRLRRHPSRPLRELRQDGYPAVGNRDHVRPAVSRPGPARPRVLLRPAAPRRLGAQPPKFGRPIFPSNFRLLPIPKTITVDLNRRRCGLGFERQRQLRPLNVRTSPTMLSRSYHFAPRCIAVSTAAVRGDAAVRVTRLLVR